MKKITGLLAILFLMGMSFSCKKSSSSTNNKQCNLQTTTSTTGTAGTVTYTASVVGNVSVSALTYKDATGTTVTVNNPTMPFSQVVDITSAVGIAMTATATAPSGTSITINWTYTNGTLTESNTQTCGN